MDRRADVQAGAGAGGGQGAVAGGGGGGGSAAMAEPALQSPCSPCSRQRTRTAGASTTMKACRASAAAFSAWRTSAAGQRARRDALKFALDRQRARRLVDRVGELSKPYVRSEEAHLAREDGG